MVILETYLSQKTDFTLNMKKTTSIRIFFLIIFLTTIIYSQVQSVEQLDKERLDAVITFADNLLTEGKDKFSGKSTPLLLNGINVFTKEPLKWIFPDGKEAILSDFVCQQNLLRTLVSLSNLTGDEKFRNAGKELLQYYFKNFQDASGLLQWGGHKFIDLKTLDVVGPSEKEFVHELKDAYPYYDFWYEVNPEATIKFIKGFWNAHVYNWKTLEISRHGHYGLEIGELWNHNFVQQKPFFKTTGLSFLDAGDDLIYSGIKLYEFTRDKGALLWAKRLAQQYVLARDHKTKLGAYQFTQPIKRDTTNVDSNTLSYFGDRAQRQFGPEFGKNILEGTMLMQRHAETIYSTNALMQIQLANELGNDLKEFYDWTKEGMAAYSKYAYMKEENKLRPLFADGTDLSNYVLKRDGYYGKKGNVLRPSTASNMFLISYARAFMVTKDKSLWNMARGLAIGSGLGDIGTNPGKDIKLNMNTENDDAFSIFALIDIYQGTKNIDYLNLARKVGNNLVKNKFNRGYFTSGPNYIYASFDAIEPYALLALEAAIKGTPDKIPCFINGSGFVQGAYKFPDGTVKTIKDDFLYQLQK